MDNSQPQPAMNVEPTQLADVKLIRPRRFGDRRGWFAETWNAQRMIDAGLHFDWVQDNHSYSARKGTLRGLHYQAPPRSQDKLVRCSHGAMWDVAVDFRLGSPTYLRHVARELSAENGLQILIPKGFLHGFLTLTDDCEVQYRCSDVYSLECDGSIRWDDPAVGIAWPLTGEPTLSEKDASAPTVEHSISPFRAEAI